MSSYPHSHPPLRPSSLITTPQCTYNFNLSLKFVLYYWSANYSSIPLSCYSFLSSPPFVANFLQRTAVSLMVLVASYYYPQWLREGPSEETTLRLKQQQDTYTWQGQRATALLWTERRLPVFPPSVPHSSGPYQVKFTIKHSYLTLHFSLTSILISNILFQKQHFCSITLNLQFLPSYVQTKQN